MEWGVLKYEKSTDSLLISKGGAYSSSNNLGRYIETYNFFWKSLDDNTGAML